MTSRMPITPRASLDKRTSSKRPCALITSSSPPSSPAPASKRAKTSTSTIIAPTDGPNANKENIPPLLELIDREFSSQRSVRVRARRETTTAWSPDVPMGLTTTPPLTPSHGDASMGDTNDYNDQDRIPAPRFVPLQTPSRELSKLSLASPPTSPTTSLQARARALLRPTSGTPIVIGRDSERGAIFAFLNPFITSLPSSSQVPTSMYVSGSPGTGKTALIASILSSITDKTVRTLYINCMGLNDVAVLWERVLSGVGPIGAKAKTSASSLHRLEHILATPDFKCILVLDELDTFGPAGLSSIFALPTRFSSSLRLIAVSNDLAQNASTPTPAIHRPSLTLPFAAYTAAEMQTIIRARLALLADGNENETITEIIQPAALTLLVKKVSAQTGDIRFALQVLRRAIDLAFTAGSPTPVGMKHVLDAVKRSTSTKTSRAPATVGGGMGRGPLDGCINALSLQSRFVLITVLIACRRSSHGLSLDDLGISASLHPSSSSKTPKKKTTPRRSTSASAFITPAANPSRLFALYTSILASSPSKPFDPVSRSEFTDLLGALETASLISLPLSCSSLSPLSSSLLKGKRRSSTGSEEDVVCLCAVEEEVLRALLAIPASSAPGCSSGPGVREQEVERVWEREVQRIDKTLKRMGEEASKGPALAKEEYL